MSHLLSSIISNMQTEIPSFRSMKSSSSITELKSDHGGYRCHSSSPSIQSNMFFSISSIQDPINLDFAEPINVNLLPQSYLDPSKGCEQSLFSEEDYQLCYLPLGCTSRTYQNLDFQEQCVLASNTQQQPILNQQPHLPQQFPEQPTYSTSRPEQGNEHQIPDQTSILNASTPLQEDNFISYKQQRQCMKDENASPEKIELRDFQWQHPCDLRVNDPQIAVSCSISEALPMNSNHGIPISPLHLGTRIPSHLTQSKKRNEDASPHGFLPPLSVHDSQMMIGSLPEKGKLLEAVLRAGPLLNTLLVAGPLPKWQNPPPALNSFEIPLVPISPTPSMMNPLSNQPELTVYEKTHSAVTSQAASAYAPLPSLTPMHSSLKKRFLCLHDSLHGSNPSLKRARLQ